ESNTRLTESSLTDDLVSFGPTVSTPRLMAPSRNKWTATTPTTIRTTSTRNNRISIFFIGSDFPIKLSLARYLQQLNYFDNCFAGVRIDISSGLRRPEIVSKPINRPTA